MVDQALRPSTSLISIGPTLQSIARAQDLGSERLRINYGIRNELIPAAATFYPCAADLWGPVAWLRGQGVTMDAIAKPWSVCANRVIFDRAGRYWPCPGVGVFALVFAVIDIGIVDLAAWEPSTGRVATRLGIGAMLGEGQIGRDGLGTTGPALPVWRSPLQWLRAARRGVVVVDQPLAAHRLSGHTITGEDARHDRELRRLLRVPPPVFVGRMALRNAAA